MFKELRPLRVNIHQTHLFGGVHERTPMPFWIYFYSLMHQAIKVLCLPLIKLVKQLKKLKQCRFFRKSSK